MSFGVLSPRSVRDGRHNRFESYSEPHVYDRVEYWQRKRERWQAEKEKGGGGNDAFASGGLFAGFGQHHSPRPNQQQQLPPVAASRGGRGGGGQQYGRAHQDDRSVAYRDQASLRPPPPLFPAINYQRPSQHQPQHQQHSQPHHTSAPNGYPSSHSSHSSHLSPLPPSSHPSYMSGVHELHGGPTPDEQYQKREAQRLYQQTLQQQMSEKEERKKKEKREAEEREKKEEEEARNYNPFGRGGGGAPMRDSNGHILANRTQALAQALSPTNNINNSNNSSRSTAAAVSFTQPHHYQQQPTATLGGYAQPAARGRVGLRSDDNNMAAQQQSDRQQWQHSLAQQIEEKANKKRREEEARREEDRREEERLQKERGRLEEEWKREREKEQLKQRAAQEELDNKARKGKADEGLTDYEREQAMKGRRIQPAQQTQHSTQRDEERKETVMLSTLHSSAAVAPRPPHYPQHTAPRAAEQSRSLPFSYDELEREMERLRADIRQESEAARQKRSEKQRQQQRQRDSYANETGGMRRRQRVAVEEEDDDTNIARFLNKQHNKWRPQAAPAPHSQSTQWQHGDDSFVDVGGGGVMELDNDGGSGVQLAGSSTFVPLPANYDSRLGTPQQQVEKNQQRQQHRSQQPQHAQLVHDSAAIVTTLPPPPPPPVRPPLPNDERPLPALAKQSRQTEVAPTLQQSQQYTNTQPAAAAEDEEMYADEQFVVETEDAQLADELVAEKVAQLVSDAVADMDEQDELHQPSEYSKLVSDVDLRDDYLESFVTSEADNDNANTDARKKNGRKKWSTATTVQTAA